MNVFTAGTFDLLHPGHVHLFRECTVFAQDSPVTVAVNTDEFITRYKGRPPVQTYDERATMVEAIRYVDKVVPNDGTDQATVIEAAHPDLIVIGSDWHTRDYHAQLGITQDWLDERGIAVVYIPRVGGWSSTAVKGRL